MQAAELEVKRPEVGWRVVVWYGNIKPEDRGSTTMSDGAMFVREEDVRTFCRRTEAEGGKIVSVTEHKRPGFWYETLEEFDRLGAMSLQELEALKFKWRDAA